MGRNRTQRYDQAGPSITIEQGPLDGLRGPIVLITVVGISALIYKESLIVGIGLLILCAGVAGRQVLHGLADLTEARRKWMMIPPEDQIRIVGQERRALPSGGTNEKRSPENRDRD